jgi:hypothetical protein
LAAIFLQKRHVAKLPSGGGWSGFGRLHFQMKPHFLFEIAVKLPPPEQEAHPAPEFNKPVHLCLLRRGFISSHS